MAKEKKPSIYADRGTIGSARELDEYGVWVKSEPQDIAEIPSVLPLEETVNTDAEFELSEMNLSEIDNLPGFGDSEAEPEEDYPEIPSMDDEDNNLPAEDDDFSVDFDDFEQPLEDTEEQAADLSSPEDLGFTEIAMDDMTETVDFSDLTNPADLTNDLDESDSMDLAEPENLTDSMDLGEPENLTDSMDMADSDASDVSDISNISWDLADETESAQANDEDVSPVQAATTGQPDLSTQLLLRIAEELSSIRSELTNLKKDFAGLRAHAQEDEPEHEHGFFKEEEDEKIALTGDELDNILNTADFTEEAGTDPTGDEISMSGEDLSSGKMDDDDSETFSINDLDGGLDLNMDLDDSSSMADDEESLTDGILQEDTFTDEISLDDTSIDGISLDDSLTDEISLDDTLTDEISLDNTLTDEIPLDDSLTDEISLDDSLTDEIPPDENSPDEIPLDEETFDDEIQDLSESIDLPDFDEEAGEELLELREMGAEHMTTAPEPEDANYLAEDPLASEDISETWNDEETFGNIQETEDSLDLSEAVIDEPDLSMEIQDNPIEEPSLDNISIDLDLEEEIPDTPEENDEEEIIDFPEENIEIPAEQVPEEDFDTSNEDLAGDIDEDLALIPEGFVVESEENNLPMEEPVQDFAGNTAKESMPGHLKQELKTVLTYMDKLLESLPDNKIEEFARSEYFDTYKKLFKELGLV